MSTTHQNETEAGQRFEFGANWARFLSVLNDERIEVARESVQRLLQCDDLGGRKFLDAGSGSGLFSLVARQLGATVTSFDFDPQSVACTRELKRRYCPDDDRWSIQQGSVLDSDFLTSLGTFDVVYSWGVLHHTGDMWNAFDHLVPRVDVGGRLAISIYNDQGATSRRWLWIKKTYNRLPSVLQPLFLAAIVIPRELKYLAISTLRLKPQEYIRHVRNYSSTSQRGMSYWHDLKDWVGGYPFEVATPAEVFQFFHDRGLNLRYLATTNGSGCNEFCFERTAAEA
ncbi:MAG: class I SAM-dependent methyltransferase [Fuerstiella sp.]